MKRRLFLTLAATATLSACGFQLRGSGTGSVLPFSSVYIPGASGHSGLAFELLRMIQATAGTEVVDDPKAAQAIIDILGEKRERGSITLNTAGRIREYSLYYRVNFRVRNADGSILMPPTEISLKRDLSYNESQAIAKEKEEEMLFRNMQSDAVQQILRRLSALKR